MSDEDERMAEEALPAAMEAWEIADAELSAENHALMLSLIPTGELIAELGRRNPYGATSTATANVSVSGWTP